MATGDSRKAWEIIESHRGTATSSESDSCKPSIEYQDLVDGWSCLLSSDPNYQLELEGLEDVDLVSQTLGASSMSNQTTESSDFISAECTQVTKSATDLPHPDNADGHSDVAASEGGPLKLFQLSSAEGSVGRFASNHKHYSAATTDDEQKSKPVEAVLKDVNENQVVEAANLIEEVNRMLADDFMVVDNNSLHAQEAPDGLALDNSNSNDLCMHLLDSVSMQFGELNRSLAEGQVEKLLLEKDEKDYETVACGDGGERFILYPDLDKQQPEPHGDTSTSLEDAISQFICTTNQMIRQRMEKWIDEIENSVEGSSIDEDFASSISVLPDEVLLKILSYIPLSMNITVVSLVCKRWYILAADPSLWQHLVIPSDYHIDPHWLGYLASKSPQLKSLSVRGGRNVTSESLSAVAQRCPLLADVDFGFCNITTAMINCLVAYCPNIHTANFEGCECVDSQWMQALCGLEKLRTLNISHCTHLVDDDIIYLSEHTSELTNVCIDGNSFLSDLCVKSLCTRHKDTLATLCIDGAESTDSSVEYAVACPNLYLFTISFADSLTDKSVDFLMMSKWLVHLQIRKNKLIEEAALQRLFVSTALQHLRHLDLTECLSVTDSVVKAICKRCPSLVKLVLGWCWNVTDEGVDCIVESLSNMRHLDLLGMDVIEGHSFDKLPTKLPHLTFLNLVQCNKIDDALMLRVLERMPQLTAINFYHEDFRTAL